MSERISRKQRIELQNVAEREVMRFADDHALWHKHIHNVELDAMQILKMHEMDEHPNTVDFSCRRTGKTANKEMYLLKFNACNSDQEGGVVAPREAQGQVNLRYHTEAIERSEILSSYLSYRRGRRQISDTYYEFCNRSRAQSYGIMSNVDGGDLTWASLEEVDDMPSDRLYSRFLLMLGSNRRLGADADAKNDPSIRITGVFKGADTLAEMVESGTYHCLPVIDCYLGIEMGILNESFIMDMQKELSSEEFIRQLLCKNVSAKNLIWEKYLRYSIQLGVKSKLQLIEPMPGHRYKKRGLISFGWDAGGHGEQATSSKPALVVGEQLGNYVAVIFCKTWRPGADDAEVIADLVSIWEYFRPDFALGDAFGVGIITMVNDILFKKGIVDVDRKSIGEGESTASTWPDWAFSPIRFEGMTKHQMAQAIRSVFHNRRMVLPYTEDQDPEEPAIKDMILFQKQVINIKSDSTSHSYSAYQMVKKKIGDDLFDAGMAMIWGFATQGACIIETIISFKTASRQQLVKEQNAIKVIR